MRSIVRHTYLSVWVLLALASASTCIKLATSMDHSRKSVIAWIRQALSSDAQQREEALIALRSIGPPVVSELSQQIQRQESKIDRWYGFVHRRLPFIVRQKMPVPVNVPAIRRRAVQLLGELGPLAEPEVPLLSKLVEGSDLQLRDCAIRALGKIGPHADQAVPALCEALDNRSLRAFAASTLGQIGPKAVRAVPQLLRCLEDSRFFVRWHSARALATIDPTQSKRIVPVLIEGLDHPILESHLSARLLAEIGPDACEAVPALIQALRKPNRYDRGKAAEALGRVGPCATSAVPFLEKILSDPDLYVRAHAAEALGHLDPNRNDLKVTLQEGLQSPDCFTRYVAARGLWQMSTDKELLRPVVDELSQASIPAIRFGAIKLLEESGP